MFDRRTDRSGGIAVAERGGTFQSSREASANGVQDPGAGAGHPSAALNGGGSAEPSHRRNNHSCQKVRCDTISAMECGAAAMRRSASSARQPIEHGKRRNVRMVVAEEVASVHAPMHSTAARRAHIRTCEEPVLVDRVSRT